MFPVQPWRWNECEEKLRSISVLSYCFKKKVLNHFFIDFFLLIGFTRVSHAQKTSCAMLGFKVFIWERLAEFTDGAQSISRNNISTY